MTSERCFHCAEPIPRGGRIDATVGGVPRAVCCLGCRAVAEFIDGQGLQAFYEHRSAPAPMTPAPQRAKWTHYDEPEAASRFTCGSRDKLEATIDIGGMYCSACSWLLQAALRNRAGVLDVAVNSAANRALIAWDPSVTSLAGVLADIEEIGFEPRPVAIGNDHSSALDDRRIAMRRLLVAAIAGMQVMMFAVALYAGAHFGIDAPIEQFLRIVSLLVCVPIVVFSAKPFFIGALRALRMRYLSMDLPVSLAVLGAFLASALHTLTGSGEVYFDSVAMFVLFLSATRYLEMNARKEAGDTMHALANTLPETALRLEGETQNVVPVAQIREGDILKLRPGDVLPTDARIVSGELHLDESFLSGESQTQIRGAGDTVLAGSINRMGNATIEVTRTGANLYIAEIGRLIERALADRPRAALLADRVAGHFVAFLLLVAGVTGLAWMQLDPERAFEIVLATLVVTCPCALALATPAALAASTIRMTREGLLIVRTRILDSLAKPSTIVFDKTGTLTRGRPAVSNIDVLAPHRVANADTLLDIAAAIERESEHVLARAFADIEPTTAAVGAMVEPGRGIEATVAGTRYRLGRRDYATGLSNGSGSAAGSGPQTEVWMGDSAGVLARFTVRDGLRDDAPDTIAALRDLGHRIVIASGDQESVVAPVAGALSIDSWEAGLSPSGKLELLAALRKSGQTVVMVGDGINDAPVLAAADASIAVEAGTALARASADSILLGTRLNVIAKAARLALACRRTIQQNLTWAIAYNLTAGPLAATGLLAPWMAALGMSLSSLLVVLNALRLRRTPVTIAAAAKARQNRREPEGAPA
ncbi:MAG: heavy metal translocating P-type ATPase [Pseudomonadota bacterium]